MDTTNKLAGIKAMRIEALHRLFATRIVAGRETGSGAGAIFYCPETERFLLVLRSPDSDEPNTWCGLGGGIEQGETPDEAVRREASEEAGFDEQEPCDLYYIGIQKSPDFVFHNFLASVDEEFKPRLNAEHTDWQWVSWTHFPENMHPQMMKALNSEAGQRVLNKYTKQ